eukprot:CAMPEP_0205855392 /NCGR_PEP_ID=MMETSP1083-20121108/2580_1 /ASSEMBLY_ACC=CAM_ASM_000430 /TAXON_ID=97485 /ORGANISM="Prymnesium parvum, Strain Texoma1" /LENGTH=41 /DNA_ID= /DNA_START= /DNA_END= /DNA_ORIENTATION=
MRAEQLTCRGGCAFGALAWLYDEIRIATASAATRAAAAAAP